MRREMRGVKGQIGYGKGNRITGEEYGMGRNE